MKTFIIAEIGTSHGGDRDKVKRLADAAACAGADCAKFQLVIADEIIPRNSGTVDLPGGAVPLYEVFRSLERPLSFYREIKACVESRGLAFLCSPFGTKSAAMLEDLGVEAYKIASPELNHYPLLEAVSRTGKPVYLSTGVSTLGDIEDAVACLGRGAGPLTLLHCITAYPAPEEEYNLNLLRSYAAVFGLPVGISDHSLDPGLVPALSVLRGGTVVEKHFTLSREGGGLDDLIALTPEDFGRMVRRVREAERALASGEEEAMLRGLAGEYGAARVEAVLGSGVKRLAASEAANYATTNRSIHALREIKAGETLTEKNIALLRTEKNLRPGLAPKFLSVVLGRKTARAVLEGQGLGWDDLS